MVESPARCESPSTTSLRLATCDSTGRRLESTCLQLVTVRDEALPSPDVTATTATSPSGTKEGNVPR